MRHNWGSIIPKKHEFAESSNTYTCVSDEQNANFRLSLRSRPELQSGSKSVPKGSPMNVVDREKLARERGGRGRGLNQFGAFTLEYPVGILCTYYREKAIHCEYRRLRER